MKKLIIKILPFADIFFSVLVFPAAIFLKLIRHLGVHRLPLCRRALLYIGVFPIRNHYYEPLFDARYLSNPLSGNRVLPGINWNIKEQFELIDCFHYNIELQDIPESNQSEFVFHFNNGHFLSGDAEYWYNLIRLKMPKKIFEVGSGYSTLMAMKAIKQNETEMPSYKCKHICIEPYEKPWLENTGVIVIREKVENIDKQFFLELNENDILFLDSSHIIRPQGDILFEYLELLPSLSKGVIVHIHDIFSPKDYLDYWVKEKILFWNEQYLLEAFLTSNMDWKIIGALNYLHHNHYDRLKMKCPFLTSDREPGSFYIQKTA